nr:unnamed protein product [Callosobruchus chinensis]
MNQLLATLRLYSCAAHQTITGDFIGCHQTTTSRILKRVIAAIARTRPYHVTIPQSGLELLRTSTDFYQISGFPKMNGCMDGTHKRLQSPEGRDADVFRNRKGYFSINTQVVDNKKLKIMDVVTRWPGSVHDQTVFNNSRIKARFQNNEFEDNVLLGKYK